LQYLKRFEEMGLKTLLTGGASELGQPDLLRKVVDGILKLKRHGGRVIEVLPAEVDVNITVADGGVQAIESFLEDPTFDRDVEAALLNRLVHAREDRMPVRHYKVKAGDRTKVEVTEIQARTLQIRVAGGDRDGTSFTLPAGRRDLLMGRGPWHGDDQQVANDVIVADKEKTVSRRAARVRRSGAAMEIEALDQREAMVVVKPDGTRLRPALAATGRVQLRPGDAIEFTDGAKTVLTLHLEEA
jgi:hypothetical protein